MTAEFRFLAEALCTAGLLPPGNRSDPLILESPLLPQVLRCWRRCGSLPGDHADGMARWLGDQMGAGADLTLLDRGAACAPSAFGLDQCLGWWTRGRPCKPTVGVVSSRLGHDADENAAWFAQLQRCCVQATHRGAVLLIGDRTAPQPYLQRAACQVGLSAVVVQTLAERGSVWVRWGRHIRDRYTQEPACNEVIVSPDVKPTQRAAEIAGVPQRDRAIVSLADQLFVLKVRRGGNIDRLVRTRLRAGRADGSVAVVADPKLVEPQLLSELTALGAECLEEAAVSCDEEPLPDACVLARSLNEVDTEAYLTHCTRRCSGPWPNQTEEQFLDECLARGRRGYTALETLRRILRQQRIVAGTRLVRGGAPATSFTAVRLDQLALLRAYRAHLHRWDFEPFGICIRRDLLTARGARPVVYGDENTWSRLNDHHRLFFQRRFTDGPKRIDWQVEQEWRVPGDVDLRDLTADEALVLVPGYHEALQLTPDSRWPFITLEE